MYHDVRQEHNRPRGRAAGGQAGEEQVHFIHILRGYKNRINWVEQPL